MNFIDHRKTVPSETRAIMKTSQKRIPLLTLVLFIFSLLPIQTVHAATNIVTNTNDSGPGSLRQAIADSMGFSPIIFDAALSGQTITLDSPLIIASITTIDGSSLKSPISISGNSANTVFKIDGGMNVVLDSLIIKNGAANFGGGIYNEGYLIVNHCTFSGNFSHNDGGAIYNLQALTVHNSTFIGNSALLNGGGIYHIYNQTLTIDNSTFYNNSANQNGGGIASSGNLNVNNSTFSGNTAHYDGGAIYNDGNNTNVSNSILSNSHSTTDCRSYNLSASFENNLIESHTGCGTPAYTADPLLAPLADNGGDTQTMALLPGSVAINAGDNATCTSTDQRGVTRTLGGTCDIGAYLPVPPLAMPA